VISSLPFSETLDTSQATTEPTDAEALAACGNPVSSVSATVWYAYTPPEDQGVAISTMSDDFQPSFNDQMREDIAERLSRRLERLARPGEEEPPDDDEQDESTYGKVTPRVTPRPIEYELVVDDECAKQMRVWDLNDLKEED
jgi:hypothetical protein